ncbi:uncharacterized protein LOC116212210 [Punica granatum]|uniref:Uncharacterized protein LOC116212210 n=1 Tax=Punica granatum TaxID=22663 RepID=A0A6P8EBH1_PUNGR|nr:uncharacterized protein LOC116212210 [Punica granatum]
MAILDVPLFRMNPGLLFFTTILGLLFLQPVPSLVFSQHQQILFSIPIRPKASPQGIPYPVASSGRGFMPHKPLATSDHAVTIANPNPHARPVPAFSPSHHLLRPPQPAPSAALPPSAHPKVTPSPTQTSKSAANGFKDPRDRAKDDTLIVVRDRKVRLSDGDSLYGLGRSWLRNGYPEEHMGWQLQYGDFAKTLPRPQPMTMADSHSVKEEEVDEDEIKEENVEDLSTKDLLKGHIKRAKRVRMRAKEERMKRISRFRTRIRLLLPPPEVEQFRSDSLSGN